MAGSTLRIASRRSQLAMVQTHWVRDALSAAHPSLEISIEAMATQGDKILDVALAKIGDKGLFTKELEAQMLVDQADIAVHSLKDLPTNLPEGLMLGCVTEREDPADALVVHARHADKSLATLPEGSVVGTSSLRRLAQLRHHYPQLTFKDVRGNVITRLEKLDAGQYDCLILAAAGLGRLGLADRIHELIDPRSPCTPWVRARSASNAARAIPPCSKRSRCWSTSPRPAAAWRSGPSCASSKVAVRCRSGSTAASTVTSWC